MLQIKLTSPPSYTLVKDKIKSESKTATPYSTMNPSFGMASDREKQLANELRVLLFQKFNSVTPELDKFDSMSDDELKRFDEIIAQSAAEHVVGVHPVQNAKELTKQLFSLLPHTAVALKVVEAIEFFDEVAENRKIAAKWLELRKEIEKNRPK
jgi:hypothetical protein